MSPPFRLKRDTSVDNSNQVVKTGEGEVAHFTLFNGGADELHNLECLHPACHAEKTNGNDKPSAAKVRRIEARENGTRRPRKPIPPHINPWPPAGSRKLAGRPFPGGKHKDAER